MIVFGAGWRTEAIDIGLSFHAVTSERIRYFDFYMDISLGFRV